MVHGFGELLPALEQSLEGMTAGQAKRVVLRPKDAYGPRHPDAVLEVDRAEFPPEVEPGDRYELENAEGGLLVLKVLDVDDSRVVLDANHPLAGQNVRFELRVLEVRPATSEESAQAEARLTDVKPGRPRPSQARCSAPERLIRGPRKRYEHDPRTDPSRVRAKPQRRTIMTGSEIFKLDVRIRERMLRKGNAVGGRGGQAPRSAVRRRRPGRGPGAAAAGASPPRRDGLESNQERAASPRSVPPPASTAPGAGDEGGEDIDDDDWGENP